MTFEVGEARRLIQDSWFRYGKQGNDEKCSFSSSIGEDSSTASDGSSSEITDDASSSGALSDLSEIMNQLPIKRGLSKFYNGKSESFAWVSRAVSVEDLAKKSAASPCRRRSVKGSKSLGNGWSCYKPYTRCKPVASAKRHRFVGAKNRVLEMMNEGGSGSVYM